MARGRSEDFKSPVCRLSYANGLFKARAAEAGAVEKFGATLIFPKAVALNGAVEAAITAEWGDKGLARAKAGLIRLPFLAGDGKEAHNQKTGELNEGLGPDVFFIRATASKEYPPIVRFRDPNIPASEAEVYSGCYGFAVLNAFAWSNPKSGDGVTFGIKYFQKTQEGPRIGG